jgi:UPF0755 protein
VRGWWIGLSLLAAGGFAALALTIWLLTPIADWDPTPVEFEILPGTGAGAIARDLTAAGLLRDHRVLLAVLVWRGDQGRIGEGVYQLRRDMGVAELADALVRGGLPRTGRFVLPEGIRAAAVAPRIAAGGWEGEGEALARLILAPPDGLRAAGVPAGASLEGYLYPATYELPLRWDATQLLQALIARFEAATARLLPEAGAEPPLPLHEWVILASMVQAEAGSDAEMPIIAGVFLNRLEIGMPLQSDPTVAYGLGKELPELSRPAGDFGRDHPFNTYTRAGLPAGPISNPGSAALAAVLRPERRNDRGQPWLYFMHGVDGGTPVFRPNVTFDAHLRDVNRYLR